MTTKQKSPPTLSDAMAELSPIGLEQHFLKPLPTIAEIAEKERLQTPSPRRQPRNDLFDGILGTLDPLLADYQEHPDKYGPETHELLEQLMHGNISLEQLSTTERALLNRATFDYVQVPPKKQPKPVVLPKSKKPADDDELFEDEAYGEDYFAEKVAEDAWWL